MNAPPIMDKLKGEKERKMMALALAGLLAITFIWAVFNVQPSTGGTTYEKGTATIDDLLKSDSSMNVSSNPVVASDSSPYYALIATPVALSYDGSNMNIQPLLVYQGKEDRYEYNGPSSAVNRFFVMYGMNETYVTAIGDVDKATLYPDVELSFIGNPKNVSLNVAQYFWKSSDGAIIITDSRAGYSQAVSASVLASYLSIPVIVTQDMDATTATILKELGVKYTIVCGESSGYKRTMRFDSYEEIQDTVMEILKERIKSNMTYVTMANPLDAYPLAKTGRSVSFEYNDIIQDSAATAYPGAAPSGVDGPTHNFTIPYTLANVKVDVKMDVSQAGQSIWWGELARRMDIENNADGSGERIYIYLGVDKNGDGILSEEAAMGEVMFFGGSPGYDLIREDPSDPSSKPLYAHFYIELPFYNEEIPEHLVQLLGKLPTDPDISAPYSCKIIVEELSDPTYPLMYGLSSMAPYFTAWHEGIVLAEPEFQLHSPEYIGCLSCGEPVANPEVTDNANQECVYVKDKLNNLLGRIVNKPTETDQDIVNLAEYMAQLPMGELINVAIMADSNMVPQYYYPSSGQGDPTEGFGIPSDIFYQDIDEDPEDAPYSLVNGDEPSFEIPMGRMDGWDVQDVSALAARTIFYQRITETHSGPLNTIAPGVDNLAEFWKDSSITTLGSEPPIGSAYPTTDKIKLMYEASGMTTNPLHGMGNLKYEWSRRQNSEPFYESANMIFFCAHGFYYWYVPTAWESAVGITASTYAGGAFDIAHVKNMEFGPSVLFGSSCVTGRIDGIPGRNALSQAFLHGGMNGYIGATRSSWGSLIPIPNEDSGESLGDFLAVLIYADLTGYIYNKDSGLTDGWEVTDSSVGYALMDAKNRYIEHEGGYDNGGTVADTFEEFVLHGDPAFNPYTPEQGYTSSK